MRLFGIEINSARANDALREDLNDVQRQLEDLGWIKINGGNWNTQQAVKEEYSQMVKRCRLAFIKSPIVAQAINLTTQYTFGEGVTEAKCDADEEVNTIIQAFWNDPENKLSLTSVANQFRLSNKIQYDGEICFALQVDTDGSVYVRIVDPLSITAILNDPNDHMRQLFYKRQVGTNIQYIPDYQNGLALIREQEPEAWKAMLKMCDIKENQIVENTYLFHVKQNNDILDARGVPDVYRALDWINANTKMNSDTATFIAAQAQFAWKKKIKGSRSQVDSMVARQRQNTNLSNPSFQAGSTHVSNEGVELDAVGLPSSTGALFETGIRRSLLMICAAFGIMEHYFGDPSTGNLATTKAMELPMLKKFLARQKFWEDVFKNVINFQLDMKLLKVNSNSFSYNPMKNRITALPARDYASRIIDIDFPPILQEDLKVLAEALSTAKSAQLCPIETAQRTFLQSMGINNVEEELQKEFEEPMQPLDTNAPPKGKKIPDKKIKEAVQDPKSIRDARAHALKLSEKNKTVLAKMGGYRAAVSKAYKTLSESVRHDFAIHMTAGENYIGKLPSLNIHLNTFIDSMLEAARQYYPQVISLAEQYVKSKIPLKETKILEARMDKFTEDQLKWNSDFVDTSLTPYLKRKLKLVEGRSYMSEQEAFKDLSGMFESSEGRVAKYVSALWVVDQRAVKEAAKESGQACNFVGVDDGQTCDGCTEALAGNPYKSVDDCPTPGELDCMGNCRHAVQLMDDEPLTESDIQILKDAEEESKKGFKLLT